MSSEKNALKALLEQRVDHSALYPPTALSWKDAFTKAAALSRTLAHPYLIGSDMVVPLDDLLKINAKALSAFGFESGLFRISVINKAPLGVGGLGDFKSSLQVCVEFNQTHKNEVPPQTVTSLETKLAVNSKTEAYETLQQCGALNTEIASQKAILFFEPDLSLPNWEEILLATCFCLNALNLGSGAKYYGFKARTAGAVGIDSKRLAKVIEIVSFWGLPFKVTGGLHHPLMTDKNAFGFLSLSVAVALARKFELPQDEILEILSLREVYKFKLTDRLEYKNYALSAKEIEQLFSQLHFSIGCCNPSIQDQELSQVLGD